LDFLTRRETRAALQLEMLSTGENFHRFPAEETMMIFFVGVIQIFLALHGRVFLEQRLKNFFQRAASTKDAGFDGTDAALEDFRNFFIAEAFEIAKDYGAAEDVGNLRERVLHSNLNFMRGKLLKGAGTEVL
jgi:hypothetical protein